MNLEVGERSGLEIHTGELEGSFHLSVTSHRLSCSESTAQLSVEDPGLGIPTYSLSIRDHCVCGFWVSLTKVRQWLWQPHGRHRSSHQTWPSSH